ncbi:MAG: putative drug exporter of the superfamily [Acidimicrobiaceae bacterium]|nr:putative drug exporter of the superfamily [Acidimicrobiaceae bacterium]
MLTRLARVVVVRKKLVLLGALVVVVVAGAAGGSVAQHLSTGGFDDPHSESFKADASLTKHFQGGQPNMVLLVTAKHGTVNAPDVVAAGQALTDRLAHEPGVRAALSYWTLASAPPLRSKDGRQALVLARIDGDQDTVHDRMELLGPHYRQDTALMTVRVGGFAEVFREVGTTIEKDLQKAEAIAVPITLLLLILVFGSVVAAGLPLGIGIVAIVGTMLVLRIVAAMTEVSIFSLNLTTSMGMGLAIDYSLFVVSRFREELRAGRAVDDAVVRTVQTAGKTVAFSALTVAASLAALLVFPLAFLRSFAYAGIAVVLFAGVAAVVLLPALLAALGHRVDSLVLFKRHPKEVGEGFWHRAAVTVMKRPVPIATSVILVLLVLGAPFLNVHFGLPDDRVLPPSAPGRQVSDQIRANFSSNEAFALSVVALGADPVGRAGDIDSYAARLSKLGGVARVDAATGSYIGGALVLPPNAISVRFRSDAGTFLSVVPNIEPYSAEGERLVKQVRSEPSPFAVKVTGASAQLVDAKASLFSKLPVAGGIIAVITFVVLFLLFGSLLVPAKAVVLNLLSLTATFGAMVWIFQEGHLSRTLGFTATGMLDTTTPILMFCVAFGLSMDYEVFLLSRIKEEHDKGRDTVTSVAVGLEHTGRIVTAAAALLAVVFIASATSQVTFIKLFGVGLTMAVLMDATLIRAALVPAFMRLAGQANWWAPSFLRRVHDRWGFNEGEGSGTSDSTDVAVARIDYNVHMVDGAASELEGTRNP